MSDDKCPNCGGELISRVSFVDYCLDCDTTIDAAYWQTRADVAEKYAKSRDAQVAVLQTALDAANEDAERLATKHTERDRVWGEICIYCHEPDGFDGIDTIKHAADCPITLHRVRVGDIL